MSPGGEAKHGPGDANRSLPRRPCHTRCVPHPSPPEGPPTGSNGHRRPVPRPAMAPMNPKPLSARPWGRLSAQPQGRHALSAAISPNKLPCERRGHVSNKSTTATGCSRSDRAARAAPTACLGLLVWRAAGARHPHRPAHIMRSSSDVCPPEAAAAKCSACRLRALRARPPLCCCRHATLEHPDANCAHACLLPGFGWASVSPSARCARTGDREARSGGLSESPLPRPPPPHATLRMQHPLDCDPATGLTVRCKCCRAFSDDALPHVAGSAKVCRRTTCCEKLAKSRRRAAVARRAP